MLKAYVFIFCSFGVFIQAKGLSCWECDNVFSDEECVEKGRLRRCLPNQNSCQIELRRGGWGPGVMISKRCKQSLACHNNFIQNPRPAWNKFQCNLRSPSGVCRCCCKTDVCNKDGLKCWDDELITCLPPHRTPKDGSLECSDGSNVNSKCTFSCNEGFSMMGKAVSTCLSTGQWDNKAPTCSQDTASTCEPALVAPSHGRVECSDKNFEESSCRFTCNSGYSLEGEAESVCTVRSNMNTGAWSSPVPTCAVIQRDVATCLELQSDPVNGAVSCTDGKNVGSVCNFICSPGFDLVGEETSACIQSNDDTTWQHPPAICREIVALSCQEAPVSPIRGQVTCTDGRSVGSVCTFVCDIGFDLIGEDTTTCIEKSDFAFWQYDTPVCKEIKCLPMESPINGEVSCTNTNRQSSECQFTCDQGFRLVGSPSTTCVADGGDAAWSHPTPVCEEITCLPRQEAPINGEISCTNTNRQSSECQFTCDQGFLLVGSPSTTCVADGDDAVWSHPTPVCEEIRCSPVQRAPDNGDVSCSNTNKRNSECQFTCDQGFRLFGSLSTTCTVDQNLLGVWSNPTPVCQEVTCLPMHQTLDNGEVFCSNSNLQNSECLFACGQGFRLVGSAYITCMAEQGIGIWTDPAPICEELSCLPPNDLKNGDVSCSLEERVGSVCTYTCNEKYLLIGYNELTCQSLDATQNPMWNREPPICYKKVCQGEPATPRNGNIVCTDRNNLGSQCQYICNKGYLLKGNLRSTCVEDDNGFFFWNGATPSCEATGCSSQQYFPHGRSICTNDGLPGSTCTFICTDEDYHVFPKTFVQNTCMDNDKWDVPTPCCARDCPPNAVMDFVVVLDSSSSVGAENWKKVKNFVRGFIQEFTISPEASYYGVFRYNKDVDTRTQILLDDHQYSKEDLLNAFDEIPYDGSDSSLHRRITTINLS